MRWPRGKYNGQRMVGLEVKFKLTVDRWRWRPLFRVETEEFVVVWLCFFLRLAAEYGRD